MSSVYAVQKGRCPGVYMTWAECQTQIQGVKGAVYQKFTDRFAAEVFVKKGEENRSVQKVTKSKQAFTVAQTYTSDVDLYVYTDGACSNNGRSYAKAGIGIWFGESDSRNVSQALILKDQVPTNNIAELTAILKTKPIIEAEIKAGKRVAIVSDSQYAIRCAGTYGKVQASNNWLKDIPNKELVRQVFEAYQGLETVQFLYVPAHTEHKDQHSVGNAGADLLANKAIGVEECPYQTDKILKPKNRIDLRVSYSEKENAKNLGARWDPAKKVWYCFADSTHAEELLAKFQ